MQLCVPVVCGVFLVATNSCRSPDQIRTDALGVLQTEGQEVTEEGCILHASGSENNEASTGQTTGRTRPDLDE